MGTSVLRPSQSEDYQKDAGLSLNRLNRGYSCLSRRSTNILAIMGDRELDSCPMQPENLKPEAKKAGVRKKRGILAHHSLSIVSVAILIMWTVLYSVSDFHRRWGAFFGNAIADWSGVVVTVVATKYLYERGSSESRKPPKSLQGSAWEKIRDHSLTLFLLVTGLCWLGVYTRSNPESKWGQVVGNVLSEWTQILALVIMTKRLIETHSKESHK